MPGARPTGDTRGALFFDECARCARAARGASSGLSLGVQGGSGVKAPLPAQACQGTIDSRMTPRKRPRRYVDTRDFLRMVARMMGAAGIRLAESDAEYFTELAELQCQLDELLVDAVRGFRQSGMTWQEIGDAAGTTRQAAHQRWARRVDLADQAD